MDIVPSIFFIHSLSVNRTVYPAEKLVKKIGVHRLLSLPYSPIFPVQNQETTAQSRDAVAFLAAVMIVILDHYC